MVKNLLLSGAAAGALAVVLGAFGAHALKAKLSPELLQTFETGVKYQFYHALAIIAVAMLCGQGYQVATAGWLFLGGIVLFSGSVYLLACRQILGIEGWSFLGPITPIGGLLFVAGWLFIFVKIIKN